MISPVARESQETVQLLCQNLEDATKLKKSGKVRKISNQVVGSSHSLDSWKFNEWDYYRPDANLPIDARGIFTLNNSEIIVRGYDKFFNIDEKDVTKLVRLKSLPGPFDVTMKENGCIIFISGLPDSSIVVCSKHSTGEREDLDKNHAMEGHHQLVDQLKRCNIAVESLAKFLYDNNLTAVAELCDDEFEEHVLPYSKEDAGLYIHGLNYNTIEFKTVPMEQVQNFAREWGFKCVSSFRFEDTTTLFDFLEDCAKTGTYKGKEIEGFVIRCTNPDFFFKYKFEQPYLLYRQFREITKKMILNGTPIDCINIKKNKYISREYLKFAQQYSMDHPGFVERFKRGHGIIEVRQAFLDSFNQSNGMSLLDIDDTLQKQLGNLDLNKQVRYVVVPVSTIGCGKTTVFQTLTQLFPKWTHIQNDNIGKSSKTKIVDHAIKALATHEVVLFDRNNASYKERRQIFDDFETKLGKLDNTNYQIEFICVNFVKDIDSDDLWEITKNRVFTRGDNHQTIKSNTDPDTAIMVMKSFIKRFQPVEAKQAPDEEFDFIIDLELGESSSLTNTKIIINALSEKYPDLFKDPIPTDEAISTAFAESLKYTPTFTKIMPKMHKVTYFGISIDKETVLKTLQETLENNQDWKLLQHMNRVQAEFHVTVGHVASKGKEAKAKWNKLVKRFPAQYEDKDRTMLGFYCDVKMTGIVIRTDRLICVKVDILDVYDGNFEVTEKIEPINKYPHITIGTFSNKIKPSESNTVLESIFKEKTVSNEVFPIEKVLEKQQMFANF